MWMEFEWTVYHSVTVVPYDKPIKMAKQSGLWTRMATESVSSCEPKRYWVHSWNWNGRFTSLRWIWSH